MAEGLLAEGVVSLVWALSLGQGWCLCRQPEWERGSGPGQGQGLGSSSVLPGVS